MAVIPENIGIFLGISSHDLPLQFSDQSPCATPNPLFLLDLSFRTSAETVEDEFNDVLSSLSNEDNLDHVHYVDLRNVLSNELSKVNGKRKYKGDWGDELHPTNDGFAKVAARFSSVIDGF